MGPVRAMRMRHANGTATTTAAKISVKRGVAQYIRISNLDNTNNLQVSFDNGQNYFTINAGDPPLEVNVLFYWILIQSDATAAYSALIGEG